MSGTIFLSFILSLAFFTDAWSQPALVMNTANEPPNVTEEHKGICDRVLTEAFRRMGIQLSIVKLPSERALVNANEGVDDGNFARVEGLEKIYPNLIRVPEEITRFEFVAFSKGLKFRADGWNSLGPYNIGIVTGWKILEQNITGAKSLVKVEDHDILFKLLDEGRIEVAVYDRMQGRVLLRKLKAHDVHIAEPALAVKNMYPYLHKKHKALVPRLAETLKQMKKDGSYQRIAEDVLTAFSIGK